MSYGKFTPSVRRVWKRMPLKWGKNSTCMVKNFTSPNPFYGIEDVQERVGYEPRCPASQEDGRYLVFQEFPLMLPLILLTPLFLYPSIP
jgi:hypothetical protein